MRRRDLLSLRVLDVHAIVPRTIDHARASRQQFAQVLMVVATEFELATYLRDETADCHAMLEARLDLLASPLSRGRFERVIRRFYGFHLEWEPAIARHGELTNHMKHRTKIASIKRDLVALGVDPAVVESQERCSDAVQLAVNRDAALGSFYVIEGSTLGGRIITRAISRESWAPVGGFATFNPYGDESGAMWREFRLLLNAAGRTVDRDAVVAGARRTFGVLANWLPT